MVRRALRPRRQEELREARLSERGPEDLRSTEVIFHCIKDHGQVLLLELQTGCISSPVSGPPKPRTGLLDIKPLVRTKPVSSWSVSRASSGTVWHVCDNLVYRARQLWLNLFYIVIGGIVETE